MNIYDEDDNKDEDGAFAICEDGENLIMRLSGIAEGVKS